MATAAIETSLDADKLNYEIFSILESKFLFGFDDTKLFSGAGSPETSPATRPTGKVRILSIDGAGGRIADGLLAAAALARLESSLRRLSGDEAASIADFFDVVAGSGAGGVLAAMLFTKSSDGHPLFSAAEALQFFTDRRLSAFSPPASRFRWWSRLGRSSIELRRLFGGSTLRDAVKPLLVPCYDASTAAPFLFSRADAVELDGCDFAIADVCAATCADRTVEIKSIDGRTRMAAVGGGVAAMGNPTAAAITHVLNNKHEFPLTAGIDDLVVVSLGAADVDGDIGVSPSISAAEIVRIAGTATADMVDQAVAMAFGQTRASNYVRIQANIFGVGNCTPKPSNNAKKMIGLIEDMLSQRNIESIMFRGKKISVETNVEKLERIGLELINEHERRKKSLIPIVLIKQVITPRTSSATTSTLTNSTTPTTSSTRSSMSPSH